MQNGLYYGRTCSQNGLCTLFIDISKQNLNIHYISNLTPDLCTFQCKELGGCITKMQYMYTTIHIRAMTTFFLGWIDRVESYVRIVCAFIHLRMCIIWAPPPLFYLIQYCASVNYSITILYTSINVQVWIVMMLNIH